MSTHPLAAIARSSSVDDASEVWTNPTTDASPTVATRPLEWLTPLTLAVCDVIAWILIYGSIGFFRRDAFFTTPLEFLLVDCLVLAVIIQAIYIVGGYSRNTETRSLTYTTEHILAVIVAAIISAAVIYSAATFDNNMRPSRGVLSQPAMAWVGAGPSGARTML